MFHLLLSYRSVVIFIGIVFCFSPVVFSLQGSQSGSQTWPDLESSEIAKIASFRDALSLADSDPARKEYVQKAEQEFDGRGPALARYFLNHQRADNSVFFFLFEAVGDTETARILIRAIPDPPMPVDMELQRHPGEIEVAVEQVLKNEDVRHDPTLLQTLKETLTKARTRSVYTDDFTLEVIISLIGHLKTVDAVAYLQTLADDSNTVVRRATADALGGTGLAEAGRELEQSITTDQSPAVREQAAEALANAPSVESIAKLRSALQTESDPGVIDALIRSLTRLEALPDDPEQCLQMAKRGWDAAVIRSPFQCWRQSVNNERLIETAVASDNMALRSLALSALTEADRTQSLLATAQPSIPKFEASVRDKLLRLVTEILAYDISGRAEPATISSETAWLAKEALWNISDHNMERALDYADRIKTLHFGRRSTGRFGASYHLANKDQEAYTAFRRPQQWLAAGFLALLSAILLAVHRLRFLGLSMLGGSVLWIIFMFFESGTEAFPPPPLWYLTVSALAFISAGFVSGIFEMTVAKKWVKYSIGPVIAGIAAFAICLYTRTQRLYPVDSSGWSTIFDPIGCAFIAILAAFILSLLLSSIQNRFVYFTAVS